MFYQDILNVVPNENLTSYAEIFYMNTYSHILPYLILSVSNDSVSIYNCLYSSSSRSTSIILVVFIYEK